MLSRPLALFIACATLAAAHGAIAEETEVLAPIYERFATDDVQETPDFQRHVIPLAGRLGCNGRACHGSFQGRGGFQLSLFGYDFSADHAALHDKESPRVDVENPKKSLILQKPTDEDLHEGGKRYEHGGWEYRVLLRWVEGGAKSIETPAKLVELQITPSEIRAGKAGEQVQLQAIAIWEDGAREDVTALCRFQSNDDQIALVDENGLVTVSDQGDTHVVAFYDNGVVPVPVIRPVSDMVGDKYPEVETPTKVDELVVQKLRKLGIVPSDLASDADFLRRLRLDMTGTLPSPQEVEAFLADKSPNKRQEKIDELLETPAYAAWWTTQLCDYTGNNDQQLNNTTPVRGQASRAWYDWINERVANNTPYDEIAAGIVLGKSRRPDQSYLEYCTEMSEISRDGSDANYADRPFMEYYWARRDFREVEARAIAFAYSFMGVRIQCAQCHKHPFDQWSKDDFHQFKQFFAGVTTARTPRGKDKEAYDQMLADLGVEGLRGNDLRKKLDAKLKEGAVVPFQEITVSAPRPRRRPGGGNTPAPTTARLLGGEDVDLSDFDDPREVVMDWLRQKDNRYFARAFVNRVWANYFNVGLVNPPDDLSLANPPSNRALLDHLTVGFIENNFDMKWLHREICNSRTYQLSWRPNETNAGDERNFSRAVPRRLPAEVAYDAINQATCSDQQITADIASLHGRAIAIPSASGRYRGNRGPAYALMIFGRSIRESNCDCDRSSEASLLQTVFLQNDREALALIERNKGWVDTVARATKSDISASPPANYERQVANLEKRIAALRKDKKNNQQVKQLRRQLAGLKQRFGKRAADSDEPAKEIKPEDIVRQAYLRSLSRYPSDEELKRSLDHLASSENLGKGARDLLWALLNTKEFIVNH